MRKPNWTIEGCCRRVGTQHFGRRATNEWFPNPHKGIWPKDESNFLEISGRLNDALSDDLKFFFYQTLCASYLLSPQSAPQQFGEWISSHIDWLDTIGSIAPNSSWLTVPMVLASDSNDSFATSRLLLVGCTKEGLIETIIPPWVSPLFDSESVEAINISGGIATKNFPGHKFVYWPIVERSRKIHGSSLGLSAYLGAFSLVEKIVVPDILLTGAVTGDGNITEVSLLPEKLGIARSRKFSAFMYPAPLKDVPWTNSSTEIEKIPVRSLKEAESIWARYSPGVAHQIADFERLFDTPKRLLEVIPDQTGLLINLLEESRERISTAIISMFATTDETTIDSLEVFTQKMAAQLGQPNYEKKRTSICLSFLDAPLIQKISDNNPSLAFRLSLLQIKLANHSGETTSQQNWYCLAENCYHKISSHDVDDKKLEFMVNKFVGKLHNNFIFEPELPEEFRKEFDSLVPWLEENYARCIDRQGGNCVHATLGRYYGVMMQHYAFCGPTYLSSTIDYSEKSQAAFGNGKVKEHRDDYLRQLCYLSYAYLDVDRFEESEAALLEYLDVSRLEDFDYESDPNPFKHALLVRFLADSVRPFDKYIEWARRKVFLKDQHPWQLWLFNLGRLEKDKAQQLAYWHESIRICQDHLGDAGQRMKKLGQVALTAKLPTGEFAKLKKEFPFNYR